MSQFPTLPELLEGYARRIGAMRQRAARGPSDTYTVALGQLVGMGLIEDKLYYELIQLPRETESGDVPTNHRRAIVAAMPTDTPERRVYKALLGLHLFFQEQGDEDAEEVLLDVVLDHFHERMRRMLVVLEPE